MKKHDKEASELDRLFFASLALCTTIGLGALVWHLRLPTITTDYLQSDSFQKDFTDRVKQLSGLEVRFGKVEGGHGLGFAMTDVTVRSADGQQVDCHIDRVQGELGRDLKFADVRRLVLTRPSCQLTVDSSLQPTWVPVVGQVGASDLKLLLGARLRGVTLEDADLRLTRNGQDAAHFSHFDVAAEGDADVHGVNVTAEVKGGKTTRIGTTLANGGLEIGFEGAVKANLPRTGELQLTADAQITEPAGTKFLGPSVLPLAFGLDASGKADGHVRIDRLQLSNPQLKTVLRGVALNSPDGNAIALKLSTAAVSLSLDAANEVLVRDATLSVDAAFTSTGVELSSVVRANNVKMPNEQIVIRGLSVDTDAVLAGGGRLELKKMRISSGGDQTLVSLSGIVDGRNLPPQVDLTGDFRQSFAPFDLIPGNIRGDIDGSIKMKSTASGALVVEGMAVVDIPEAREASVTITDAKAEIPFRFEVSRPEHLAEWLDVANPDQLLDKYFATARSFDLTARGTIGSVKITPAGAKGTGDEDVTLAGIAIDSTYRLVPGSGRTEMWGRAHTESIIAPSLDGDAVRDLNYKVDAGFAYHQDNDGSLDLALDFTDKAGKVAPTRAKATLHSRGRELSADYHVAGPLFAFLAKTAGLDVLVRHESAAVAGTVRFAKILNRVDLKSWTFLPFNFPYDGEVSGSGRFALTGISYDYLEGVRRISVPELTGTFDHSDGGAGHRLSLLATAERSTIALDNGTSYEIRGLFSSVDGSFQTPLPSASAPFRVELKGQELVNTKTGASFPALTVASSFEVKKATGVRIAAFDIGLAGDKIATGSGSIAGFYPLAGVDFSGDVTIDPAKLRGLTSLADGVGVVHFPVRLTSAGNSLRLAGTLTHGAVATAVPVEFVWKFAADNFVESTVGGGNLAPLSQPAH